MCPIVILKNKDFHAVFLMNVHGKAAVYKDETVTQFEHLS